MLPNHASSLLRLLPGVIDDETEKEVARSLDYQPLALASTAIHVRKVRKGKMAANFGLTDYLKKLGLYSANNMFLTIIIMCFISIYRLKWL